MKSPHANVFFLTMSRSGGLRDSFFVLFIVSGKNNIYGRFGRGLSCCAGYFNLPHRYEVSRFIWRLCALKYNNRTKSMCLVYGKHIKSEAIAHLWSVLIKKRLGKRPVINPDLDPGHTRPNSGHTPFGYKHSPKWKHKTVDAHWNLETFTIFVWFWRISILGALFSKSITACKIRIFTK